MREITLNLPDNIDLDNIQCSIFIASKLYEKGTLSLGQAAEMVGLTKSTFIEMLGKYSVSVFNYNADELENELICA